MKLWDKPGLMLLRVALLLLVAYYFAGEVVQRAVTATVLPVTGQKQSKLDPRIYYDPSTQPLADAVAALLPQAIAQVESQQGAKLEPGFKVRTFFSPERYSRHGACPPGSRACTFRTDLALAPGISEKAEHLLPLITHELSHVLMQQRMGMLKAGRIPPWFAEGLAVNVSGGGGAENVTVEEARLLLLSGRSFQPNIETSLFGQETAQTFGLEHRMFYRQSGIFVDYLRQQTSPAFKNLLAYMHAGGSFEQAFAQSYPKGMAPLWSAFIAEQIRIANPNTAPAQVAVDAPASAASAPASAAAPTPVAPLAAVSAPARPAASAAASR